MILLLFAAFCASAVVASYLGTSARPHRGDLVAEVNTYRHDDEPPTKETSWTSSKNQTATT